MKTIPLSGGKAAVVVDDEDYDALSAFAWFYSGGYASRQQPDERARGKRKRYVLGMHRMIMGLDYGDPRRVDHKNGNKLDNRRSNLRICTQSENGCNRGPSRVNTSGFKGVAWNKQRGKWTAHITHLGKAMNLGGFDDPKEAFEAYLIAAKIFHGEFAYLSARPAPQPVHPMLSEKYLPCPICRGVEGCDHTVPERARADKMVRDAYFEKVAIASMTGEQAQMSWARWKGEPK